MKNNVGDWPLIPRNQIKEGSGEKQWRKIFQNGDEYDEFEKTNLSKLSKKIEEKRIQLGSWFDQANKLRFLQANKFKIQDTCASLKQASNWRETTFPLKQNPLIASRLNQGSIYLCGRDQEFRPILAAEIKKLRKYEQEEIRAVLNQLLQYTIDNLLIPGQVQNYVLIVSLDDAGMSDLGSIKKLVSFTSNTYRSRLFANYLLNMPYVVSAAFNGIASSLVSENTLKKIKVSRKGEHQDMWTHIDKEIIEQKYGGTMKNIQGPFWPASSHLLNYCPKNKSKSVITKDEYNKKYKQGKLGNRKIKQSFLEKQVVETPLKGAANNLQIQKDNKVSQISVQKGSTILNGEDYLPMDRVKKQIIVPIKKREFKLFFEYQKYSHLFNKSK